MTGTMPHRIPPVLVLSTGRCGSTLVSDLLNRHPAILSMSEFFMALGIGGLRGRSLDGAAMWRLLSTRGAGFDAMLRDGQVVEEVLYPLGSPGARYTTRDLPPVMAVSLPHLTDQPEALFDELAATVPAWPRRPMAAQYEALFGHLSQRFGRRVWVERSGGSLMFAAKLLRMFPDARVVHVFRDGRDTAMSMAGHHNFRVIVALSRAFQRLGVDLWRSFGNPNVGPLDTLLNAAALRLLNTERVTREPPPLVEFGRLWSRMIQFSETMLGGLPPERVLNLRFEDLQDNPRAELDRLIRFIHPSLADAAWLEAAAALPRPSRPRYPSLPPAELQALTEACGPGLDLLGYAR